jgi:hypothetical protein
LFVFIFLFAVYFLEVNIKIHLSFFQIFFEGSGSSSSIAGSGVKRISSLKA